ncbi:MAG: VOC family protein [Treponema sp.]|nr:VOC family protein [Treponema sp.]
MKLYGGIQQIGVGVEDAGEAWNWYSRKLGFDIPLIDDSGIADIMLRYTGGEPRRRRAILALNLEGGGGLEIWQYLDRKPLSPGFEPRLGDLGVFAAKLKSSDLGAAFRSLGESALGLRLDPGRVGHFFLRDPFGTIFQAVSRSDRFTRTKSPVGGVCGALIGVSDLEAALSFYTTALGFDTLVYDVRGVFEDLAGLPGGEGSFRRALIARSAPSAGPFSRLLGAGEIELFQALDRSPRRLFEERLWGDLGFIHLCFDVQGMEEFKRDSAAASHPFTVDSDPEADSGRSASFDMGTASGRFAYLEDPDGTLMELVETHRLPILARLGWHLDLRGRNAAAPLPSWMLRLLGLGRKKASNR